MKKEWNGRTVFFLAMAMTLICFLPFLIRDKGLFIYLFWRLQYAAGSVLSQDT